MTREDLVKEFEKEIENLYFSDILAKQEIKENASKIVEQKCKFLNFNGIKCINYFEEFSNKTDETGNEKHFIEVDIAMKDGASYKFNCEIKLNIYEIVELKPIFIEAITKYNEFIDREEYSFSAFYKKIYETVHLKNCDGEMESLFDALYKMKDNLFVDMANNHDIWGIENMITFQKYVDTLTPILKALDMIEATSYSKSAILEKE